MREPPNYLRIHKPLPAYVLPVMDATIEQLRIAARGDRRDRGPIESLERRLIGLPSSANLSAEAGVIRTAGTEGVWR